MKLILRYKSLKYEIQSAYDKDGAYTVLVPTSQTLQPYYIIEPDAEYKGGSGSGNFGHTGRPGKIGGSGKSGIGADVDYLLKNVKWDVPGQLKMYLSYNIGAMKLDTSYFDGLQTVTDKPFPGHRAGKMKGTNMNGYTRPDGSIYHACYNPTDKAIRINDASTKTFIHELGHHVWFNRIKDDPQLVSKIENLYNTVKEYSKDALSSYGLRKYSVSNVKEFFADSFSTYIMGDYKGEIKLLWSVIDEFDDIF